VGSLLGVVPHVIEDLRYGQARNFHMTTVQFEWFSGVVVLATAAAALGSMAGSRFGTIGVLAMGVLWSVIGAADHYRAFVPGDFRTGLSSRLWVWLLIGLQAAASVTAALALRRPDRGQG
jgi:hypothetical protein